MVLKTTSLNKPMKTAVSTKMVKTMKEKAFKEKAIAEIKQAIRNVQKGVFLF